MVVEGILLDPADMDRHKHFLLAEAALRAALEAGQDSQLGGNRWTAGMVVMLSWGLKEETELRPGAEAAVVGEIAARPAGMAHLDAFECGVGNGVKI